MAAPLTSNVVIECPNCGTRYQLPADTVGPKGRQVACAHCGGTWKAKPIAVPDPDSDTIFDEQAEAELDAQFDAAAAGARAEDPDREARERTLAEIRAAIAPAAPPAQPSPDPDPESPPAAPPPSLKGLKGLQQQFLKRQAALNQKLPFAKLRRLARISGIIALIALIAAGIGLRTEIVRRFPDLAGLYEAVGLGVNIVGLEFRDVTTTVTLRNGDRIMRVDGTIFSTAGRRVAVPKALVTLLDGDGDPIYEWSITPEVNELEPGEMVGFTAQLTSPPAGASRVRLGFINGRTTTQNL